MAVLGKEALLELVRYNDVPYWTIYQDHKAKESGNFIAQFRPESEAGNTSLEASISQLNLTLSGRLAPGRYIFTAYKNKGQSKGGISTYLEAGAAPGGQPAAVAGIGGTPMFMEGVGMVTGENFQTSLDAWYEKKEKERLEREKLQQLEQKVKDLEAEAREKEGIIEKGLYSIGAVFWPQIKGSPVVREMLSGIMGAGAKPAAQPGSAMQQAADQGDAMSGTSDEDRITNAIMALAEDKDDNVADILEALARLKNENPEVYAQGKDFIKTMA